MTVIFPLSLEYTSLTCDPALFKISPGWTEDKGMGEEIFTSVEVEYFVVRSHARVTIPEQSIPPAHDNGAEGNPEQPPPAAEQT